MTDNVRSVFSLSPVILVLAFLLDLAIGDPRWLPHPVRIIGRAITRAENLLRKWEGRSLGIMERGKGILLVIIIVGAAFCAAWLAVHFLLSMDTSWFLLLASYLLLVYLTATAIAAREFIYSASLVIESVRDKDIGSAKKSLSMIVGRDTENLSEKGTLRAAIETLSENLSDGVVAPIFYLAVGGLPLALTYKAINTLDSMVGYKNDKYKNFGWAAARLDDIANYIPARITGILIAVSSGIASRSLSAVHYSLKTMFRDGGKHTSPNAGIPEAAMAGALGVRLGGPSTYGGIVVDKPYIGTDTAVDYLTASEKTITVVKITSLLGTGIAAVVLYARSLV